MVGWHHRLNRHELEQTPGDNDKHGTLACCSPQGLKVSDTTELKTTTIQDYVYWCKYVCF